MKALLTHTRTELVLNLRNGEQLLVSLVIPLLLLAFFSSVKVLPLPAGVDAAVDFLTPGILALAVMSSAMVSLGISTGFERQYGVLKRLGATPLGRGRWVAAKISMVLALLVIQVVAIVVLALALGWWTDARAGLAVIAVVLGALAFGGLGLALAGTLKGTVNLAVTNGLYLVLLLAGGMIIPLDDLPGPMATLGQLLPAGALSEVLQASFREGAPRLVGRGWCCSCGPSPCPSSRPACSGGSPESTGSAGSAAGGLPSEVRPDDRGVAPQIRNIANIAMYTARARRSPE